MDAGNHVITAFLTGYHHGNQAGLGQVGVVVEEEFGLQGLGDASGSGVGAGFAFIVAADIFEVLNIGFGNQDGLAAHEAELVDFCVVHIHGDITVGNVHIELQLAVQQEDAGGIVGELEDAYCKVFGNGNVGAGELIVRNLQGEVGANAIIGVQFAVAVLVVDDGIHHQVHIGAATLGQVKADGLGNIDAEGVFSLIVQEESGAAFALDFHLELVGLAVVRHGEAHGIGAFRVGDLLVIAHGNLTGNLGEFDEDQCLVAALLDKQLLQVVLESDDAFVYLGCGNDVGELVDKAQAGLAPFLPIIGIYFVHGVHHDLGSFLLHLVGSHGSRNYVFLAGKCAKGHKADAQNEIEFFHCLHKVKNNMQR